MPPSESSTLKSQYAEKFTADLEQNTTEQERIRAEIISLQEQLSGLEQDQELLVGMRAALGDTATVPAPRGTGKKTATSAKSSLAKKTAAKKATAKTTSAKKTAGQKTAGSKTVPAEKKTPALTDLIHEHLSGQSEPRTAGEITKALAVAYPHRNISDNLVRTTTERLVARSRVERAKQGSTVYYAASRPDDSVSTAAPRDKEPASDGA